MRIDTSSNITFGYSHELKTLYKKGVIPLKRGFYGGELNKKNATIEHLECICDGGLTTLDNIVITTSENNCKRGNKPLKDFINFEAMEEYFNVFKDKVFGSIDGNEYIKNCKMKISKLLGDEHAI